MTRTERRRRQQRRRRAAMQRAACLALALLAVAAAFAWSGRPQEPETPEATVPVTATALPAETPALEPITTVEGITTQPCQFYGYDPSNPVDPDILALVEDVLARWMAEKECVGSVGRVLPKEYLYFTGDGAHNYFTTEWQGGQTWDWSLESPYEG